MTPVLLGLGTNLGDRAANLRAAVAGLRRFLNVTAVSPVYETTAAEGPAAFLNQALAAETDLAPGALVEAVRWLEWRLGRVATKRGAPRPIDIDVLFYADRVVREPGLEIPHPALAESAFVLAPAADIAPGWQHPESRFSIAEMLQRLGAVEGLRRVPAPAAAAG